MKKVYILALALCGFSLNAQFTDDFESYPEGPYFGGHWSNWSGSDIPNENIEISTMYASSGTKSGLIGGNGIQDAILKLGNKFSGTWSLQQKLYIPTGSSGYYNFQEDEVVTTGIWGIEFYFGYIAPDFPENNSFLVATDENDAAVYLAGYDHPYDTWFTMTHVYDLDEGTVRVYFNDEEIYNGNSYLDSFQLGGMDYYSADPSNQLYIDDIVFAEGDIMMAVSDVNSTSSISVYPTVANEFINVSAKSNITEVAVFNTMGQQVLRVTPQGNTAQLNVSSLPEGVYVVKTMVGKEMKSTKVIVK